jgi:hypothetical protein
MAHDSGFALVPDDMFIKYIPLSFICAGICPDRTTHAKANKNPNFLFIIPLGCNCGTARRLSAGIRG